jgi:hypothetical protein
MSRLTNSLARTDGAIRELTGRIELYRNRIAQRSKNPASAEQAAQLLPSANAALDELVKYRKRLLHAAEVEAYLSPHDVTNPARSSLIPRNIK